ncbi:SPT3 Dosage dependent suppressor of Ty-induced promoter mutations-like protein [Quaeritorhiza haematococci]|nr:SPT3 Dosage dependent suppressor of Ty-induced promoter mutations-like protein [Quaeritorhiza haematococci]
MSPPIMITDDHKPTKGRNRKRARRDEDVDDSPSSQQTSLPSPESQPCSSSASSASSSGQLSPPADYSPDTLPVDCQTLPDAFTLPSGHMAQNVSTNVMQQHSPAATPTSAATPPHDSPEFGMYTQFHEDYRGQQRRQQNGYARNTSPVSDNASSISSSGPTTPPILFGDIDEPGVGLNAVHTTVMQVDHPFATLDHSNVNGLDYHLNQNEQQQHGLRKLDTLSSLAPQNLQQNSQIHPVLSLQTNSSHHAVHNKPPSISGSIDSAIDDIRVDDVISSLTTSAPTTQVPQITTASHLAASALNATSTNLDAITPITTLPPSLLPTTSSSDFTSAMDALFGADSHSLFSVSAAAEMSSSTIGLGAPGVTFDSSGHASRFMGGRMGATVPAVAPTISKVVPSEGPTRGGLEITVLGSGFYEGIIVMFGETAAIPTQFWSPTTLVCILPPSPVPGPVPVTVKRIPAASSFAVAGNGRGGENGRDVPIFTYKDDSDRALLELALQVIGLRMTGKLEDARAVAMRIVNGESSGGGGTNLLGMLAPQSQQHHQQHTTNNNSEALQLLLQASALCTSTADLEVILLRALESAYEQSGANEGAETAITAELLLPSSRGRQTLLHLACISGMTTLAKWIIERLTIAGSTVDARDMNGFTPLCFAAWMGRKEIVEALLEAGAAAHLQTAQEFTPARLAADRGFTEITDLLNAGQDTARAVTAEQDDKSLNGECVSDAEQQVSEQEKTDEPAQMKQEDLECSGKELEKGVEVAEGSSIWVPAENKETQEEVLSSGDDVETVYEARQVVEKPAHRPLISAVLAPHRPPVVNHVQEETVRNASSTVAADAIAAPKRPIKLTPTYDTASTATLESQKDIGSNVGAAASSSKDGSLGQTYEGDSGQTLDEKAPSAVASAGAASRAANGTGSFIPWYTSYMPYANIFPSLPVVSFPVLFPTFPIFPAAGQAANNTGAATPAATATNPAGPATTASAVDTIQKEQEPAKTPEGSSSDTKSTAGPNATVAVTTTQLAGSTVPVTGWGFLGLEHLPELTNYVMWSNYWSWTTQQQQQQHQRQHLHQKSPPPSPLLAPIPSGMSQSQIQQPPSPSSPTVTQPPKRLPTPPPPPSSPQQQHKQQQTRKESQDPQRRSSSSSSSSFINPATFSFPFALLFPNPSLKFSTYTSSSSSPSTSTKSASPSSCSSATASSSCSVSATKETAGDFEKMRCSECGGSSGGVVASTVAEAAAQSRKMFWDRLVFIFWMSVLCGLVLLTIIRFLFTAAELERWMSGFVGMLGVMQNNLVPPYYPSTAIPVAGGGPGGGAGGGGGVVR